MDGLHHGFLGADFLDHAVRAQAAGQLLDLLDTGVAAFGDDVSGAELPRESLPVGVAAERDDPLGAELPRGQDFDVCVRSSQLGEVIELVRRTPDVQFVLDHVGKPRIGEDPSQWRLQIAELAARPNIVCKLSGLMTEIVSGPTGVEAVQPFLTYALAEFGPDRCLFGTDWPVMTTAATYSEWLDLVIRLVPGEDERRAVHGGDG